MEAIVTFDQIIKIFDNFWRYHHNLKGLYYKTESCTILHKIGND